MSAYRIGLLLALGVGVNLAWGENTGAAPNTNPIGKVLTATGAVRIDHSTAITEFIDFHSRIRGNAERTSISESDAELTVRAGLNDVA